MRARALAKGLSWLASTAAGSRFATAVPDVVSTAASFFSSPPPLPPPDRA